MKMEQSVPKRPHIKFRRRGITQKIKYNNLQFQPVKSNIHKETITELLLLITMNFFFFHWHYSPLWALACRRMSLHFSLSITNSLHLLTPRTLTISFYFFSPSFPGFSSSSRPFQFLSEDLFGHPILLHSLHVTQPTYSLPLYPLYYIFSFTQLF